MKVAALALALLVTTAGSAAGQPDPSDPGAAPIDHPDQVAGADYDPSSTSWNGLTRLIALARGLGLEVETSNRIDWSELDSSDILLILYPTDRLEPSFLAAFIRNGGRVLLADDFGDSREAMGRLGMLREEPSGVDAVAYHAERSYAPIARPWLSDHPLANGVDQLVTNHPAVISSVQGAEVVFGFGDSEGLVAAGGMGADGRVVVLSDPSVLINRMLQFGGNMQFAVNALRYLARPGVTRRLVVLHTDLYIYGEPRGLLDDGTLGGKVDSAMADFNRFLDERNDYLLTSDGVLALSVALALLIGLASLVSVPLRRKTPLDGSWTRATDPTARAPGDFEELVAHFDHPTRRPSYSLPAAILRDTLNAELERRLEVAEPLHSLKERDLIQQVGNRCGQRAAQALQHVYPRLKSLPNRWQAASPWTVGYLGRREFERLHADVEAVERSFEGD